MLLFYAKFICQAFFFSLNKHTLLRFAFYRTCGNISVLWYTHTHTTFTTYRSRRRTSSKLCAHYCIVSQLLLLHKSVVAHTIQASCNQPKIVKNFPKRRTSHKRETLSLSLDDYGLCIAIVSLHFVRHKSLHQGFSFYWYRFCQTVLKL